jgi:hypothetical protein
VEVAQKGRIHGGLSDKSMSTLLLQETWLYQLPTVRSRNITRTPRSSCPSATTSATGKNTSGGAAPHRGAASISRTGTYAGNGKAAERLFSQGLLCFEVLVVLQRVSVCVSSIAVLSFLGMTMPAGCKQP